MSTGRTIRRANGSQHKLHGQGPRAFETSGAAAAAAPLRIREDAVAADVTPCRICSAEALQRRTEAGPGQLQREVGRRTVAPVGTLMP